MNECAFCGREFKPGGERYATRTNAMYCGRNCKTRAWSLRHNKPISHDAQRVLELVEERKQLRKRLAELEALAAADSPPRWWLM